jgi:hypothetical protein
MIFLRKKRYHVLYKYTYLIQEIEVKSSLSNSNLKARVIFMNNCTSIEIFTKLLTFIRNNLLMTFKRLEVTCISNGKKCM